MKYAVIQNQTVINIIEWDGVSEFQIPQDISLIGLPNDVYAGIGSSYTNGQFGNPPQTPNI